MKRRNRRKRYTRLIVSLLAAVVLLTSSQWFQSLAKGNPDTQTGYSSLIEFQVDRWNGILDEVFEGTMPHANVNGTTASVSIPSTNDIKSGNKAVVKDGNRYFNWDTANTSGLAPWSGNSGTVTLDQITKRKETIQYEADSVQDADSQTTNVNATKVDYTVYDVNNADELYCVMNSVKNAKDNIKINLCADINLDGEHQLWNSDNVTPACNDPDHWYYIEGNGYTIYNMKTRSTNKNYSAGFLGYLQGNGNSKVVLKNLNFSNCLIIGDKAGSAVVVGMNTVRLYMENVNVKDSFLHSSNSNVSGLLGRNQCTTGAMFMHNCSTSGLYAFGADHVGGFSGTFYNTEGTQYKVRYDTAFPKSPESWMADSQRTMPLMVENCYSVDSELFSMGTSGDSGAFISCGAKFICRNSFTNNIIYGSTNTGAFIGRIVTEASGGNGMQDDEGKNTVSTYFENCYASGSVEGRDKIGGFVGYDCQAATDGSTGGMAVYKNCYTTAMAGMDYAGKQVGGFIGHENTTQKTIARIKIGTNEQGTAVYTSKPGAVYINCYAAGEVGNILTETDADYKCASDEKDTQGGFLGAVGCWGFNYSSGHAADAYSSVHGGESNGNYINCYYDKQTTGMRERASGKYYSFAADPENPTEAELSQIPGVTGVYTQYSDAKDVMGLTYSRANEKLSVTMDELGGSSTVWMYRDEYYPALSSFFGSNASTNFGTLKQSGTIIESTPIDNGSDGDGIITASEGESVDPADDQNSDGTTDDTNTSGAGDADSTEKTEDTNSTDNSDDEANIASQANDVDDTDDTDGSQNVGDTDGTNGTQNTNGANGTDDTQNIENTENTENAGGASQNPEQNAGSTMFSNDGIQPLNAGDPIPTYDEATLNRIQAKLTEKANLVPNYSQASVSTVFLDHWDSAMNMDTGGLSGETNWVLGLESNRLTQKEYKNSNSDSDKSQWSQDDDGKYWEIAYKNLASGEYELKVQAGDSWTYNFGADKFNGSNCTLQVPQDCDVKVKFDYVAPASTTVENTTYRIWAEFYNDLYDENGEEKANQTPFDVQELGYNKIEDRKNTWTVVGSLPGSDWNRENTDFDMEYVGTGLGNGDYKLVKTLTKGDYSFQITKDHLWDECYGLSGNNGRDKNMTFTLKKECEVTILFNENTHLTKVETNPADALETSKTGEAEVEGFEGYSVISSKAITGYNWLENLDAVKAGKMTDDDGDGTYTTTFTVTGKDNFYKNYGYKVITDGKDEGIKTYFYLSGPGVDVSEKEYTRTLRFEYDPSTGVTKVVDADADGNNTWVNNDPDVTSWHVFGSSELTGASWDENLTDEQRNNSQMQFDEVHGNVYTMHYEKVPAGTHSFKVAANGSFESGIEYGDINGNNYQFTTNVETDVTIAFDPNTKEINISTGNPNALVHTEYVVSGTASLTGSNWDVSDADNKNHMDFINEYRGTYTKTYPVQSGGKYAFKVVHAGKEDKVDPIRIQVDGEEGKAYTLKIDYHERNALTEYHLYDEDGNDVTDLLSDLEYDSWSVLGEKGLTGYNWEDAENNNQTVAAEAGKMAESNGLWTKKFTDIAVSTTPQILNFKVVAEGTWDSGVSYGDSQGNNYTIALQAPDANTTKCDVTITFNPDTHEINVSATSNCLMTGEVDESGLVWYIAGDYTLVSEDAYYTAPTVYDTVRDITASFTFTNGSHVNWDYDAERNSASGFFSKIGTTEEGTGFDLNYNVEDQEIKGTFNEKVITLEGDEENGYRCDRFMPGKQWVKVTAHSEESGTAGSRSIRLIPTAYLEAGNDADVYVLQSESDTALANVGNTVVYKENDLTGEVTFDGLEGKNFNRYNVALTAAYAITDRIGFGYYGNYSAQNVVDYDENQTRPNELADYNKDQYFAMSSVFTKKASYRDTDIAEGETSNLIVDELVDQNLIGSSYGEGGDGAKTIIKVARVIEGGGTSKVFMTRNKSDGGEKDRAKTTYEKNYLKWTGQMPFDSADAGTYEVTYYWSLSDGRYLSDTKEVKINSGLAFIKKYVDTEYFEIEDTKNENAKTLKYTVTYNNPVEGEFSIVDVLPFDKDVRKDSSQIEGFNSSQIGENTSLKLKNVTATIDGVEGAKITSTTYTTDSTVKKYLTESTNNEGNAAEQILGDASITWSPVVGEGVNEGATAIKVSGTQPAKERSEITLTYEIEVSNAQKGDYYVNNAFFTAKENAQGTIVNGVSNPVLTAAVGREFSGYVWLDSDVDGRFDDTEPAIEGVKVTLQKQETAEDGTVIWEDTGRTITSRENGYYEFTDIYPAGTYRVVFSKPDQNDGKVKLNKTDGTDEEVEFEKLNLTRRLAHYQVELKSLSRNIANHLNEDKESANYKKYFINEELPTTEQIFDNNTQPHFMEGSVTDYYFTRLYQNLGLTKVEDVEDKANSLTIEKREGNLKGELLGGVKFKLEYSLDGNEYHVVNYYEKKNEDTGLKEYVFVDVDNPDEVGKLPEGTVIQRADAVETPKEDNPKTGELKGTFRFVNLPTADYRLTEVEALDGYNPLGAPVEFELPYVTSDNKAGYMVGKGAGVELDGLTYFYDVTYTITNSKPFHMPLTGRLKQLLPLILAIILFVGAIGLYTGYRYKRGKAGLK